MALFLVVSLANSTAAVDAAVESNFPGDTYKIEPGKWAISADLTTARQVSTQLGLRETHNHIVVSMRGYSGRSKPDLWEWLSAKAAKLDA